MEPSILSSRIVREFRIFREHQDEVEAWARCVVETHELALPDEVDPEHVPVDVVRPGELSDRLLAVMFGGCR